MASIPTFSDASAQDETRPGTANGASGGRRNAFPSGWWVAATLLAVAFITFVRRPDFVVRPQFWGEDAPVLFAEARASGWHTLFAPHPDYLIVAQRLVACLAAPLPALWVPWVYGYAAWAYLLLAAWFCLRARLDYLLDYQGRIALALALVLAPQGGETMLVLIGSQWSLAPILCLLILQTMPQKRGSVVVDLLGLALAGLSGPFIVFFAPWFLLRFRRVTGGFSAYNIFFVATVWCLAAWQVHTLLQARPRYVPFSHDPHEWSKELGFVLPGGLFFGAYAPRYLGRAFWVISPALLVLLGWGWWRAERTRAWAGLALCGCAAAVYAGGLVVVQPNILETLDPFAGANRYFYPVYVFAMWWGVLCCQDACRNLRAAAAVAVAMMLLASASVFNFSPQPNLHWEDYAKEIDAGKEQRDIPVLPVDWRLNLPARK